MSKTTLTAEQRTLQEDASQYATRYLVKARSIHTTTVWPRHTYQRERFELTRPLYRTAVQYGLIKFQIPQSLGGSGSNAVDAAVAFEETYAVDPSVTLSLSATGLGLLPLVLGGTSAQQKRFLQPFLAGKGEPLASLLFSEPSGTAGWLSGTGLQTTARREGDYWIINGAKEGNLNSLGWDRLGADLHILIARATGPAYTTISASPRESVVALLITRDMIASQRRRDPESWQVLGEPELPCTPAVSGPHVRIRGFRVPATSAADVANGGGNAGEDGVYVLAVAEHGAQLVRRCLAQQAAVYGACAVGVMRAASTAAERFARRETRGLTRPLATLGNVERSLAEMRSRISEGRTLVHDALRGLETNAEDAEASCHAAMMRAQDAAVLTVMDAMRIVGPAAARAEQPFTRWLESVASLPVVDSGVWTLEGGRALSAGEELVNGTRALAL